MKSSINENIQTASAAPRLVVYTKPIRNAPYWVNTQLGSTRQKSRISDASFFTGELSLIKERSSFRFE